MTACTLVPRTATEMPADRSPSLMRDGCAPARRMSLDELLVARTVENDHDQIAHRALEPASRSRSGSSETDASRWIAPFAAGPTMIFHVAVGA